MRNFLKDVRYALRMMMMNPGFTVVAVAALSLGIGANSAIFSVVNAVLLRPLPFETPERLVVLWGNSHADPEDKGVSSYPDYADLRDRTQTLADVAAYGRSGAVIITGDEPISLRGVAAAADIFGVLDLKPTLGRAFTRDEDQPGRPIVLLLSTDVWQRRFNSDPNIVGRQLNLNGRNATVIGILPPGFRFPVDDESTDFVQALAPSIGDRVSRRGAHFLELVGRLKPGMSLPAAQTELSAIALSLAQRYTNPKADAGIRLVPLQEELTGSVRPALLVLLGAVALVLLIACANVANLLLARAAARQKEIAIRTALGASRSRIIRQLLTESLLLSMLGGALGLLLAVWCLDLLMAITPPNITRLGAIGLDARVLFFTMAVSVITGFVFGLAPALQSSKTDLNDSLKEGGRGSTEGLRQNRVRSLLVVSEVALSLLLLIGAGLLIQSFLRLRQVNPGFDPSHVLMTELSLPRAKYTKDDEQRAFFHQALDRIGAIPGVEHAAAIAYLPFNHNLRQESFTVEGRPPVAPGEEPGADDSTVSPDYFRAMSIPVLKGRVLTERDGKDAPPVVVISETFARRFFPGEDPIGRRLIIGADPQDDPNPPARSIVGIVGDVHRGGLDKAPDPEFYVSYLQAPERYMDIVVRTTAADPASMTASVRSAIRQLDSDQYVPKVVPIDQLIAASIARRRFSMILLGVFAGLAMVMAAVGIYGVMAYSVTRRTHEIGIRIALGAQARDVLRLVVAQGMVLVAIGVGLGLAGAFALTRLMSSLLYGVAATDPLTFAVVALLIVAVAFLACLLPARRATKVDPMEALRYE